jgi:hypothetical protein
MSKNFKKLLDELKSLRKEIYPSIPSDKIIMYADSGVNWKGIFKDCIIEDVKDKNAYFKLKF